MTIRRVSHGTRNTSDIVAQRALSVSLNKVGGVRLRQGNLAGALQAEQESLEICPHPRPSTPTTLRDAAPMPCISVSSVGDVKAPWRH